RTDGAGAHGDRAAVHAGDQGYRIGLDSGQAQCTGPRRCQQTVAPGTPDSQPWQQTPVVAGAAAIARQQQTSVVIRAAATDRQQTPIEAGADPGGSAQGATGKQNID